MSQTTEQHIASLVPALQIIAKTFLAKAREKGYDLKITHAYRSPEQQAQLYAEGRGSYVYNGVVYRQTKNQIVTYAKPGQSLHNTRRAFDVYDNQRGYNLNWNELADLAESLGLVAGHRWKIVDSSHYEYHGPDTLMQVPVEEEETSMKLTPDQARDLYRTVLLREPENDIVIQNREYVEFMNGAVKELHDRIKVAEAAAPQVVKLKEVLQEILK